MVQNLFTLAGGIWSPWMEGLSIRLILLSFIVFIFIIPVKKHMKILYVFMTAALLVTVSNLTPRSLFQYAALPAAPILIAGVVSEIKHKVIGKELEQ